jgi:hypothetical protein
MGRWTPLTVYGPKGLKAMTDNMLKAWEVDLEARTQGGHARPPCKVDAHEITPGVVYEDRNITATAFPVYHGDALVAFGYRIETPDRTIVLSGDTSPTQSLLDHCSGCDVLVHEAYPLATFSNVSPAWQEFRRTHHTSSKELAEIANIVKPNLVCSSSITIRCRQRAVSFRFGRGSDRGNPTILQRPRRVRSRSRRVLKSMRWRHLESKNQHDNGHNRGFVPAACLALRV